MNVLYFRFDMLYQLEVKQESIGFEPTEEFSVKSEENMDISDISCLQSDIKMEPIEISEYQSASESLKFEEVFIKAEDNGESTHEQLSEHKTNSNPSLIKEQILVYPSRNVTGSKDYIKNQSHRPPHLCPICGFRYQRKEKLIKHTWKVILQNLKP